MTLSLRAWLRARRIQQGLRQRDIVRRTCALHGQITLGTLSRLETGRFRPTNLSAAQVTALCQVLEITPAEWDAQLAGEAEVAAEVAVFSRRRSRPSTRDGQ
ncbi:helix-turn-helix domain-containing protein [Deinococcus yunweiensis]|uniref:helix-turn-helix domain-containing protein n=1 Tax=Deinococcus yunweiensis TaxID=367282 RepID=UPI00398E92A9